MKNMKNTEKKILIVSHSADLGGSENSMLFIAKDLARRGNQLHFFIPYKGPLIAEIEKMGGKYTVWSFPWWVKNNQTKKSFEKSLYNSLERLMPIVDKFSPDVVFSNNSLINIGAWIAKIVGVPHIWRISEFGIADHGIDYMLNQAERADYINRNATKVLFTSESLRKFYSLVDDDKAVVIMNSMSSIPNYTKLEKNSKSLTSEKGLQLLSLGTIQKGKGQMDAVRAVSELVGEGYKDIRLRIIGRIWDNGYYDSLRKEIEKAGSGNNIIFENHNTDIESIFCATDVLLMCSRSEAFGRVTLESLLRGRPVIGANSGATPEIVINGKNGYLYKSGNIVELKEKILSLYNNRKVLAEYSEFARKDAIARFDEKSYLDNVSSIFSGLSVIEKTYSLNDEFLDFGLFETKKIKEFFNEKTLRDSIIKGKDMKIKVLEEEIGYLQRKPTERIIKYIKNKTRRKV